jgi:hypothetical protein
MTIWRCMHCQTPLGEFADGGAVPHCPPHPDSPAEVFDDGDPPAE